MKEVKKNFLNKEEFLQDYATKSIDAIRLKKEKEELSSTILSRY